MRVPAVLLLAFTVGCSVAVEDEGPIEGDEPQASAQSSVQGAVIVDQVATRHGARTRVSARFVRVSGGIDQAAAEQVIGAPRFDASSPLGCGPLDGEEPMASAGGSIELLDVGELLLHYLDHASGRADDHEPTPPSAALVFPLAARAFPDVGELVSGIVYTSRDGDEAIPFGGRFAIESSGSPYLDGFTVTVDAPRPLSGVSLASGALRAGSTEDGVEGVDELIDFMVAGDDLALAWDAGQLALGDRIYVDVTPSEIDPQRMARTVRCVFEDDGEAAVPAALIGHRPGTVLDVEIHRHRRTVPDEVTSSGHSGSVAGVALEEAVVDFDFAVAARVVVADDVAP